MTMNKHIGHKDGYEYIPFDDASNYFSSQDFSLAVTLICKGFELATLDHLYQGNSKKYVFLFEISDGINDVIDNYWAHRVSVDPLEYENHRKNLKSRMFSLIKN